MVATRGSLCPGCGRRAPASAYIVGLRPVAGRGAVTARLRSGCRRRVVQRAARRRAGASCRRSRVASRASRCRSTRSGRGCWVEQTTGARWAAVQRGCLRPRCWRPRRRRSATRAWTIAWLTARRTCAPPRAACSVGRAARTARPPGPAAGTDPGPTWATGYRLIAWAPVTVDARALTRLLTVAIVRCMAAALPTSTPELCQVSADGRPRRHLVLAALADKLCALPPLG